MGNCTRWYSFEASKRGFYLSQQSLFRARPINHLADLKNKVPVGDFHRVHISVASQLLGWKLSSVVFRNVS